MEEKQLLPIILEDLEELSRKQERVFLALDGRCAAGKTTFAAWLQKRTGCSVISMDHFFLRPEQRTKERLSQPGGNVDYERVREEALVPAKKGEPFSYRPFNCHGNFWEEPVRVEPGSLVVIEGSYSCHPTLGEFYDRKIFLTVSFEEQLRRIEKRNGREALAVFEKKWIPLEELYFRECRTEEWCDSSIQTDNLMF